MAKTGLPLAVTPVFKVRRVEGCSRHWRSVAEDLIHYRRRIGVERRRAVVRKQGTPFRRLFQLLIPGDHQRTRQIPPPQCSPDVVP